MATRFHTSGNSVPVVDEIDAGPLTISGTLAPEETSLPDETASPPPQPTMPTTTTTTTRETT